MSSELPGLCRDPVKKKTTLKLKIIQKTKGKEKKTLFHFVRTKGTLNTEKKIHFKTSYDIVVDSLMNIFFCKTCILCLLHESQAQNMRILDPTVL